MNMFIHELKTYRKATIIWTIAVVTLMGMFMTAYPSFSKDAAQIQKLFDAYPKALMAAFNIDISIITSILGLYSMIFTFVILCGAIQAMNLGLGIVSNEERSKTADFLLSKPSTRQQILTSKILASLTCLVITNIIFIICTTIVLQSVRLEPYNMNAFLLITFSLFLTQLIFFTVGLLISIVAKKIRSVLPISLGIVFGLYILSLFGSVIGDDVVKYITPFKYFDSLKIIRNSAYEAQFVVITILIIILSTIGSYILYQKRDMAV